MLLAAEFPLVVAVLWGRRVPSSYPECSLLLIGYCSFLKSIVDP
jgi:hypothetical protein